MSRWPVAVVCSVALIVAACGGSAKTTKKAAPAEPAAPVAVSEEVAGEQARLFIEHLSEQR